MLHRTGCRAKRLAVAAWLRVTVLVGGAVTVAVLVTQVCQWPYEGQHGNKGQPYLSIDADGSGECNGYAAAGALALIDQLVTHAEAIRQQLRTLGSIQ